MEDLRALQPLINAIAEHLRDQGRPIPSDEELIDCAKNLLSFFEILISADGESIN